MAQGFFLRSSSSSSSSSFHNEAQASARGPSDGVSVFNRPSGFVPEALSALQPSSIPLGHTRSSSNLV